jgi:hypothetical protein
VPYLRFAEVIAQELRHVTHGRAFFRQGGVFLVTDTEANHPATGRTCQLPTFIHL